MTISHIFSPFRTTCPLPQQMTLLSIPPRKQKPSQRPSPVSSACITRPAPVPAIFAHVSMDRLAPLVSEASPSGDLLVPTSLACSRISLQQVAPLAPDYHFFPLCWNISLTCYCSSHLMRKHTKILLILLLPHHCL